MLFIFAVLLASLAYGSFFVYNTRILSAEKLLLSGTRLTLRNFSIFLAYTNILVSLFNAYAFNIASKWLMKIAIWLTMIINFIGLFGIGYVWSYGIDKMSVIFRTNIFSMPGLLIELEQLFGTNNAKQAEDEVVRRYEAIAWWFIKYEGVSIICLHVVVFGSIIRQFMRVHIEKEARPNILTTTIIEPASLRSDSNAIRVR